VTSTHADYRPLPDDANDADLAEQRTPASAEPDDTEQPEPLLTELPDEVSEADAVEQAVSVPYGDEDYR
jgi:hypothetical protein